MIVGVERRRRLRALRPHGPVDLRDRGSSPTSVRA
jgi:hypothetical protein